MSFISLSEVNFFLYFMSAEGTNEIYNFKFTSRDEIKLIFTPKT